MTTSQTDGRERLRSVRKKPFESLVHEHGPVVLRLCVALLGPDDAEDAWSETFLAALRSYPGLPADANTEAWLVTIAKRKSLDLLRSTARQAVPLGELPETASGGEDVDADFDLALLTARQRDAVTDHYLDGMPYAEIADKTGGTEAAARRAAADGIKALREQIATNTTKGSTDER
jgi:RNA polymerase sigma factor (sigma-70 family)